MPSETVTFVFGDVKGSTVRWELDAREMSEALAEHDELWRTVIEANHGVVFSTGGDGCAAAFEDPVLAVQASVDAQGRLRLRVRVGAHTGPAEQRDGAVLPPRALGWKVGAHLLSHRR